MADTPKSVKIERLPYDGKNESTPALLNAIRKNFEQLSRYYDTDGQLDGFKHLEFLVPSGASQVKIKHGLGFVPKDVIITRLLATSGVKLTLHHDMFDTENLVVSATGDVRVRMFLGTYKNSGAALEDFESAGTQEFKAVL